MKNKNILAENEQFDTEFDLNNIDYSAGISELSLSFNKLAKKLLNKYEIYLKSSQKKTKEVEDNEITKIADELKNLDDKQVDSKLVELDELLASFDKIIEFVLTLKQQNSFVLLILFQKTNLIVIQLIEFLNKLLNNFYQKNEFIHVYNQSSYQFDLNSDAFESNGSIIGKSIQLLHVITSN